MFSVEDVILDLFIMSIIAAIVPLDEIVSNFSSQVLHDALIYVLPIHCIARCIGFYRPSPG